MFSKNLFAKKLVAELLEISLKNAVSVCIIKKYVPTYITTL